MIDPLDLYTFDSFRPNLQSVAYEKAWKLSQGQADKGLLLVGPVGVGKTHLALAVRNQVVAETPPGRYQVMFTSEVELLARIRETYKPDPPETEAQVINLCKGVSLFILDDLCKYTPHDPAFRNRVLFDILDFRCVRRKPIMVTANNPLGGLVDTLGAPIVDRLRDMCEVVVMKGASQRGK